GELWRVWVGAPWSVALPPVQHGLGELVEARLLGGVWLAALGVVTQAPGPGLRAAGAVIGQVHLQLRVCVGVEGILRLDIEVAGRGGARVRAVAELAQAPRLGLEVHARGARAG